MNFTLTSNAPHDTLKIAQRLVDVLKAGDTLLLHGDVGAGKTDLARGIIQAKMQHLDMMEDVPSPSFTLVQSYQLGDLEFFHVDLYRLTNVEELYELGLEHAFETAISLVEWPSRLGELAPHSALNIDITIHDDTTRVLKFFWTDNQWSDRLKEITKLSQEIGQE